MTKNPNAGCFTLFSKNVKSTGEMETKSINQAGSSNAKALVKLIPTKILTKPKDLSKTISMKDIAL